MAISYDSLQELTRRLLPTRSGPYIYSCTQLLQINKLNVKILLNYHLHTIRLPYCSHVRFSNKIQSLAINSFSFPVSPLNLSRVLTFTGRVIIILTRSFIRVSLSLSLFRTSLLISSSRVLISTSSGSFSYRTLREPLVLPTTDILIKFQWFST